SRLSEHVTTKHATCAGACALCSSAACEGPWWCPSPCPCPPSCSGSWPMPWLLLRVRVEPLQDQVPALHGDPERGLVVADAGRGQVLPGLEVEPHLVARTDDHLLLQPPAGEQAAGVVAPVVQAQVAIADPRHDHV